MNGVGYGGARGACGGMGTGKMNIGREGGRVTVSLNYSLPKRYTK
jgi:hypothetical protein